MLLRGNGFTLFECLLNKRTSTIGEICRRATRLGIGLTGVDARLETLQLALPNRISLQSLFDPLPLLRAQVIQQIGE